MSSKLQFLTTDSKEHRNFQPHAQGFAFVAPILDWCPMQWQPDQVWTVDLGLFSLTRTSFVSLRNL